MKKMVMLWVVFFGNYFSIVNAEEINIFDATRKNDLTAIKAYIQTGGDIDSTNRKSYTAFILAAYYGHTQALQILLKAGAEPCALDNKGNNALMGVAFKGHKQVAKWLLEKTDCHVNHQNYAGQTAMMMASLFGREHLITLFLKHDADPDIIDNQGNTASTLAQAQGLFKVVEIIKFHLQ